MTAPLTSAPVKVLSTNTQAGYAADWALFTDWCTATDNTPLPADWATMTAFTAGCPGAPATIRRRLAAIAHHHRAADLPAPADPRQVVGSPARELIDPGQVDMSMRLLPSHGWTAGLFGRRIGRCSPLPAAPRSRIGSFLGLRSASCTSPTASPPSPTTTAPRTSSRRRPIRRCAGRARSCGGAASSTPRSSTRASRSC